MRFNALDSLIFGVFNSWGVSLLLNSAIISNWAEKNWAWRNFSGCFADFLIRNVAVSVQVKAMLWFWFSTLLVWSEVFEILCLLHWSCGEDLLWFSCIQSSLVVLYLFSALSVWLHVEGLKVFSTWVRYIKWWHHSRCLALYFRVEINAELSTGCWSVRSLVKLPFFKALRCDIQDNVVDEGDYCFDMLVCHEVQKLLKGKFFKEAVLEQE